VVSPSDSSILEILKRDVVKVSTNDTTLKERVLSRKTLYDKKVFNQNIERHKLPNFPIVKYIFENDVIDMLVFLVLRFYSEVKTVENADEDIVDYVDYIGYKEKNSGIN